jgi:activator of 2-hydroxyglutaryl-CoA dehydratase
MVWKLGKKMYVGGVDIGSKTAKAVIIGDNGFLTFSVLDVRNTMEGRSKPGFTISTKKGRFGKSESLTRR